MLSVPEPFFGLFLKKFRKFDFVTHSQEWINQNTKFCIPFCKKTQALTRKCQLIFFIIFTVSGVTAVRSDHVVMLDISDIDAQRVKI